MIKNKRDSIKKFIIYILALLSILSIMSNLHPTFNVDEEYTMGLIYHSFNNIIKINNLDVHPPTYYLLLKIFLNISTFWTKSLIIKIYFARLFSLSAFFISFVTLYHIIKYTGMHVKWQMLLFLYLLLPAVSFYAVCIRMHGLSAMFNILEFYELLKFNDKYKTINLFLGCIYCIVASYIDYFSAISAFVFLLIFFVKYMIHNNWIIAFKLCIGGIISFICSIPIIFILMHQIEIRKQFNIESLSNPINFKYVLVSFTQSGLIEIIILIVPIFWSFLYFDSDINILMVYVLVNYFLSNIIAIVACVKFNVYEPKFMYSQFSIYSFFIISIMLEVIKHLHYKFISKLFICLLALLALINVKNIKYNVNSYVMPSFSLVQNIYKDSFNRSPSIVLNYKKIPKYLNNNVRPKQIYVAQYSVYMKSIHKYLIIKNSNVNKESQILNGENKLLLKTFNNLRFSK